MSLPKYIINLPELSGILEDKKGEEGSRTKAYDTGKQKSKGMRLVLGEEESRTSEVWTPEGEIFVTGIKLGISQRDSWVGNKIDVLLNNNLTFDSVYFKKESDYKNFRVFEQIKKDGSVEVILTGRENTEVFVDIDYIDELGHGVEIGSPEPAEPSEPVEPPEPEEPEEPSEPDLIYPEDEKPPVVIHPHETIAIGEITITEENTKELSISLEVSENCGNNCPALIVGTPNGETFVAQGNYLNNIRDTATSTSNSYSLAKRSEYSQQSKTLRFAEPMEGVWQVNGASRNITRPYLIRLNSSHPYKLMFVERENEEWKDFEPEPFE